MGVRKMFWKLPKNWTEVIKKELLSKGCSVSEVNERSIHTYGSSVTLEGGNLQIYSSNREELQVIGKCLQAVGTTYGLS